MGIADNVLKKYKIDEKTRKELNDLTKPPRQNGETVTKFRGSGNYPNGNTHQMDLLFLPEDSGGAKYLLVVTDIGSGATDAKPLEFKRGGLVLSSVKEIYDSKKYFKKLPKFTHFDAGTEFNETKKWFLNQKIGVRTASTARHKQQALVEAMNKVIGGTITKIHLHNVLANQVDDKTYDDYDEKDWVVYLPDILEEINKRTIKRKEKPVDDVICGDTGKGKRKKRPTSTDCDTYFEGDLVRIALDYPKTTGKGTKLPGTNFRTGDVRWSVKPHKITNVLLYPNQPIRYVVEDVPGNTFSKFELQPYDEKAKSAVKHTVIKPKLVIESFLGYFDLKKVREPTRRMVLVKYQDRDARFNIWVFKDDLVGSRGGLSEEAFDDLMKKTPKPKRIAMTNKKLEESAARNKKVDKELDSWLEQGKSLASFMES